MRLVPVDDLAAGRYPDLLPRRNVRQCLGEIFAAMRMPDQELKRAYDQRIEAARYEMRRFGVSGVPTLLVGGKTDRQLLPGTLLFGRFDLLVSQLQAA